MKKKTKPKPKYKEPKDLQVALWLLNEAMESIKYSIINSQVSLFKEDSQEFSTHDIDKPVKEFLFEKLDELDFIRDKLVKSTYP
jgi:hypothetical protein